MNWKIFLTAFASLALALLPENMIGCGPVEDPYDYFTSFFSRSLGGAEPYKPFYYTRLLDFYDDSWYGEKSNGPEADPIIREWQAYAGTNSPEEAANLVYAVKKAEVDQFVQYAQTGKSPVMPDSVRKNSLAAALLAQKKGSAFQYLSFAKKVESLTWHGLWEEAPPRDSLLLNNLMAEAEKREGQTGDAFLKEKYAFQRCKLAFYNNRPADCIRWYDARLASGTAAVKTLAWGYKAGSLFRQGRLKEAAYEYSKLFPLAGAGKKQVYLGFFWATRNAAPGQEEIYAALGKTDKEKAAIHALYGLYGKAYRPDILEKVFRLDPTAPLLDVLAIREINKVEEGYLSPRLQKEKGGNAYYLGFEPEDTAGRRPPLTRMGLFFEKAANSPEVAHKSLYLTGAAYLAFIDQNYAKAKALIAQAQKAAPAPATADQLQLINLLVMANEQPRLDKEREAQILPSVQWLAQKAKDNSEYAVFFRNLFSEIIAQKYHQQGDLYREALAYGLADEAFLGSSKLSEYGYYSRGLEFVQQSMDTKQLVQLFDLLSAPNRTPFENYLVQNTSFTRNQVLDVIGTSYLRDFNFNKAAEWLAKATNLQPLANEIYHPKTNKTVTVNVDPFYDYLNDWQRYDKGVAKAYTKLTLAQKIAGMQKSLDTMKSTDTRSRTLYQLASAFYNMSHYGNSWEALNYYRSGTEWNTGHYEQAWQKEYFGLHRARSLYQQAHDLTQNKEFKAACYFMVAKCAQRQIPKPGYGNNYDEYEKQMRLFERKFRDNPFFTGFQQQYGSTKFYQYTYNRCSYLRDFVAGRK
ncbi:hypothetical protein V9K67_07340 [Paraflavisolibacter sp. H34]|uniref:hypothetical protein n=1 Tax=Huijunlia imazamoxiresistens TaxID=3127457 RepID=UPI0030176F7E